MSELDEFIDSELQIIGELYPKGSRRYVAIENAAKAIPPAYTEFVGKKLMEYLCL
jgi:hypothetical protein